MGVMFGPTHCGFRPNRYCHGHSAYSGAAIFNLAKTRRSLALRYRLLLFALAERVGNRALRNREHLLYGIAEAYERFRAFDHLARGRLHDCLQGRTLRPFPVANEVGRLKDQSRHD